MPRATRRCRHRGCDHPVVVRRQAGALGHELDDLAQRADELREHRCAYLGLVPHQLTALTLRIHLVVRQPAEHGPHRIAHTWSTVSSAGCARTTSINRASKSS